ADFPAVPEYQRHRALGYTQLAALLADTPRHPETAAAFGQAHTLTAKLATGFPRAAVYQEDLAVVEDLWGRGPRTPGRPAGAEPRRGSRSSVRPPPSSRSSAPNAPRGRFTPGNWRTSWRPAFTPRCATPRGRWRWPGKRSGGRRKTGTPGASSA